MMKKKIWMAPAMVLLAVLLLAGCATSQKSAATSAPAADESWRFHTIVDLAFVQPYVKMPRPENVVIIDSRPKRPKYDDGYIPTAVSIPDSQFEKMTGQLPADKNTLLIFYCEGPS